MAFVTLANSDIAVGKPVKQALMQQIKDNFDDLNTRVTAVVEAIVPNGSFEVDSDSDGIPDNWTRSLYTGGSSSFDTSTPVHGAKAYKITSPGGSGNGGGYLDSDYILCSPNCTVAIGWLLKSSVAGIHNLVEILWYTAAKSYISTATLYDSAANPTSWTAYVRGVAPPSTAMFFKIRITGAKSDNTAGGTAYFDGVYLAGDERVDPSGAIAEQSTTSSAYIDRGSIAVALPFLSAASIVELKIIGQARIGSGAISNQRFRLGSTYSNESSTTSTSYVTFTYTLLVYGVSGSQTLYQQLCDGSGDVNTAYGKVDAYSVVARIIRP